MPGNSVVGPFTTRGSRERQQPGEPGRRGGAAVGSVSGTAAPSAIAPPAANSQTRVVVSK